MSAVKALQQWCRVQCQGYRDVSITNMTTSFRDGLAFCALIHKHRPDLIDFDSLEKQNVYDNNKLAFKVAEEELGIPALLDAEDMVALMVPDRLSILTYVSQYYNYFHGRSPIGGMGGIKRPAEGPTEEPSGKKNQPVVSKVFHSSKPTRENSPPSSFTNTRPPASPRQPRNATQDAFVEKSNQSGTLSNKCVSCNKHVHLVQRHLVDGKLYHRSCAKSLLPSKTDPLRDLPTNTPASRSTPVSTSAKTNTNPPSHSYSRLGPTWLSEKPNTPVSSSPTFSTSSPAQPASSLSTVAKDSQASLVSKPKALQTTCESTGITTTSITNRPTPAPRQSVTALKTEQSKLKFLESDNNTNEEKKTTTNYAGVKKTLDVPRHVWQSTAGQTVTVEVNVGGSAKKDVKVLLKSSEDKNEAAGVSGVSGRMSDSSKAKAAAFISKKLAEENNNNSKPPWAEVGLKKSDKSSQAEAPKETMGVKGRVKLKADPSLLADLQTPELKNSAPSPGPIKGLKPRTQDRGTSKPSSTSNITSENESSADWRLKLKSVSKEAKPAGPSQSSPKSWSDGAAKSQTSKLSVGPSPSPHCPVLGSSVTPPPAKGLLNGRENPTSDGTKSEPEQKISKLKPEYICKEDIIKELQDIEDSLNELEKRGVELELRLRSCEEEGEDDSLMDGLMVEWFNLIRNKQVAMRRESELVYIGRTQDLEEQQPSVEQELRKLMEKPEHLKTTWHRKREEELMSKLVEIVNDRNAIVEGLDEDRIREEEEDEQLNNMMKNFNIKKEKTKKKSQVSKLFSWGNKKE